MKSIFDIVVGAFIVILIAALVLNAVGRRVYTVEVFPPEGTIRITCWTDCDLAAMIAEAREAVEK